MLNRLWQGRPARSAAGQRTVRGEEGTFTLVGRPGDRYFERASFDGRSERNLRRMLDRVPRTKGAAFDVGANIGLTSLLMAHQRKGPVYAFEPHPETFGYLQQTVAANEVTTVTPINWGFGRTMGEIPFYADEDSSASHVVDPNIPGRTPTTKVTISTIDAFGLSLGVPVDFIKIDAEGSEPDILAGAQKLIARHHPAVYVEFNLFTLIAFSSVNPRDMLQSLRQTFPFVYRFVGLKPYPIKSDEEVVHFLHHCLTKQQVAADLFCTFDPL